MAENRKKLSFFQRLYLKLTHKHKWKIKTCKASMTYSNKSDKTEGVAQLKTCYCGEEVAYFIPLASPPERVNVEYVKRYLFDDDGGEKVSTEM